MESLIALTSQVGSDLKDALQEAEEAERELPSVFRGVGSGVGGSTAGAAFAAAIATEVELFVAREGAEGAEPERDLAESLLNAVTPFGMLTALILSASQHCVSADISAWGLTEVRTLQPGVSATGRNAR
eukprot:CAMPEP_0197615064 /NCGR_PEP_ID=MMETSP1326-20131121/59842_1 /TAXON_ID=1155430 /ORGANISM="Genus nov. species nov., Strain RCC2288" /LENGTH=128 /DNA_ID=CAMNT_0043183945 /DNA_START=314 /DNA_END=701 /DNA_ORIENTATION=-